LSNHAAQRGLRQLRSRIQIILDFTQRPVRIHHFEVADRVHFHRDVVLCNDVLWRNVKSNNAQRYYVQLFNRLENELQPHSLQFWQHFAKSQDHATFPLFDDPQAAPNPSQENRYDYDWYHERYLHRVPPQNAYSSRFRVRCNWRDNYS